MLAAAFLRRNPNLARTSSEEEGYAFASPRTWDFAIHLMASCDLLGKAPKPGQSGTATFTSLVEGSVGRGIAVAFVGFLQNLRLPDPDEVLDGKASVEATTLRDDELYVLFSSLAASLVKRKDQPKDRFLDATLSFLRLSLKVCESGKVDTIFVPMKQVARGYILHEAALRAQQTGRLKEFQGLTKQVFEETPLKDFVNILTSKS
jgi:hypothetical protein